MGSAINYGIDLGTTNSAVARQSGVRTDVLTTAEGSLVPSAVYIGADKKIRVGKAAMERGVGDPGNIATEFKRLMGTPEQIDFPAAGLRMSPVSLSAEVLKSLLQRANLEALPEAAVITIPAMFQLPQCEATKQAAKAAGLRHAPLLQEPIAAAIASVGNAELRGGYWLIYDFGGGTFDVSLLRSRGGRMQVLDHDGDNHLGGKDFDRILARRAAEAARSEGRLGDFRRSNAAFNAAFARLKAEAERVRIALSDADAVEFRVDNLAKDPDGKDVSVSFELTRGELEALIRPTIVRTAAICRQMLERTSVRAAEVRRLVLVGGPTLTPCLPAVLEAELGIEARHFVNPLHAVAIGAAIYASTQQIPERSRPSGASTGFQIHLVFEAMTNDPRPLVAGRLLGDRVGGNHTVRIVAQEGQWSSEAIPVRADGGFATRLPLEVGKLNTFVAEVYRDGMPLNGIRNQFSILHGTTIAKPLLAQSIGVILADNTVRWYLRKGSVLPAKQSVSQATTVALKRGQSGDAVQVPLIQGEHERGDRNTIIGMIQIRAQNLARDLPAGTEVIVTLEVDEYSTTKAEAFVPILNQTFSEVVRFSLESKTAGEIKERAEGQRARLAELGKLADELKDSPEGGIDDNLRPIEDLIGEGGADDLQQASSMLGRLTSLIDGIETKNQQARLAADFASSAETIGQLLEPRHEEERRQFGALENEFRVALAAGDWKLATVKFQAVKNLEWSLLRQHPQFWIKVFEFVSTEVLKGPNAAEARLPIDEGKSAVGRQDWPALVDACMKLIKLLPQTQQAALPTAILSHVA